MTCLASIYRDRRGAALLEMTVVTPFLILLGLGVFEFSNLLYGQHLITTGVRDAARYLARRDDPLGSANAGIEIAVMGEVSGTAKRVSWWNLADVSVTLIPTANPINVATGTRPYRGPDPLNVVRVSTTVTYPGLGMLSAIGISSSLTLTLSHEERVVGE